MEVRDVAVGVGIYGVVGRIGVQFHRIAKFLIVFRLRARVGLNQRLERFLHQGDADPFAFGFADDRSVMRPVYRELFVSHSVPTLVGNCDASQLNGSLLIPVLVIKLAALFDDGFQVFVDIVHAA